MYNIMVVDDEVSVERLINQRFRKEISEGQYVFQFARDGEEALNLLEAHPETDCVVTDINMPRMDGLTLLGHVQTRMPLSKTIIVSAYGDLQNIRTAMNRGAFDFLVKPLDFNDLRVTLQKTIKQVQGLKDAYRSLEENQRLKMYVNPAVFQVLQASLPGQTGGATAVRRVVATVGFIDICGFTRLSEQVDGVVIRDLLNLYFDLIAKEVLRYGGFIDKFIGDAALVVFEGKDHLVRAALAIRAVGAAVSNLLSRELTTGHPYPHISAGLNSGEMVSGEFGSQTLKRFDFTVIGDVVNVAARVESLAGPGQILVPTDAVEPLREYFRIEPLGVHKIYNKKDPLDVSSVLEPLEGKVFQG